MYTPAPSTSVLFLEGLEIDKTFIRNSAGNAHIKRSCNSRCFTIPRGDLSTFYLDTFLKKATRLRRDQARSPIHQASGRPFPTIFSSVDKSIPIGGNFFQFSFTKRAWRTEMHTRLPLLSVVI